MALKNYKRNQNNYYNLIGLLIFVILILNIFFLVPLYIVNALSDNEELNKAEYIWCNRFTKFKIDKSEFKEGEYSIRFDSQNINSWMNFAYIPDNPLNLSNNKFIDVWVRIQNTSIDFPLSLVFDDIEGRKSSRFLSDDYGLLPMRWARIVIDPYNYNWETPEFDKSQVVRIRFTSYNGGRNYSQSIWIDNLKIITYEEPNMKSTDDLQGNWFLTGGILLFLSIAFLVGFTTFRLAGLSAPENSNLPLMFPIYLAFGVSSLITILTFFSLVYINILIMIIIIFSSFAILLKGSFIQSLRKYKIRTYSHKDIKLFLPVLIFSLSFLRFAYLATKMGWAPIVDPQYHGMFTSIILNQNRIPLSFSSAVNMSSIPTTYPFGFHVLSAYESIITNLYPGQSMLVVATAVIILIPSLLFSAVYISTNSAKLSFIAFLLTYFLPGGNSPSWRPNHDMLLGLYTVGAYPNLLGNMIFITILTITIVFDRERNKLPVFPIYILLLLALGISYYPLLPFAILFLLLRYIFNQISNSRSSPRILKVLSIISIMTIALLYLFSQKLKIKKFLGSDSSQFFYELYMRYSLFAWDSPYIIYTILILTALPFSLWFIFKNKFRNMGIIYLIFFLLLMSGQNRYVYTNFLWFTMPSRLLILGMASSYLVLLLGISYIIKLVPVNFANNRFLIRTKVFSTGIRIKKLTQVLIILSIFFFFTPSLMGHIKYNYPYYDYLPYGNDLATMKWLINNVNKKELVLNDITHTSYWLNSFKIMNIINEQYTHKEIYIYDKINGSYIEKRMIATNKILSYPWDYEMIENIVKEYNISYIYINEGHQVQHIGRGIYLNIIPWKNISQEERIIIYMQNPILDIAYKSGNAAIYKICGREKR